MRKSYKTIIIVDVEVDDLILPSATATTEFRLQQALFHALLAKQDVFDEYIKNYIKLCILGGQLGRDYPALGAKLDWEILAPIIATLNDEARLYFENAKRDGIFLTKIGLLDEWIRATASSVQFQTYE